MHLLQYFDKLSLKPENAKELKSLILDLAIRGRLTEEWRNENPDVEPASVLLEKIKEEKARLIKEKKIRKEKPLPEIADNEIPFELPPLWGWSYLGNIGYTNVGLTYKPKDISTSGTPVLRSSNIQQGEIDLNNLVRVETKYREKDIIRKGDLLICARNGSRRLVGKCALIKEQDEIFVFGAFMAIFRSKFNGYIQLFIKSPLFRSRLDGVGTTTINQITQRNLKSTLIPLPPLPEQKAIVEIVNQLMEEVDQLEAETTKRVELREDYVQSALRQLTTADSAEEWKKLQAHFTSFFDTVESIDKLKEAILQLAVQGKLTKQWRHDNPDVEPASVLLEKIKEEKARLIKEKKIRKEKALPEITEEEEPFDLPVGWEWSRMIELCKLITDGTHHTPTYTTEGVPFLSVKNLSSGYLSFEKTRFISKKEHLQLIKRCHPEHGDVLLTKVGTTGIAVCIDVKKDFSIFVSVALLKINNKHVDSKFLEHFINSPFIKNLSSEGTKGVGNKNLVLRKIKSFLIPLPPLPEQKAIVEIVNQLMAFCDEMKETIEQRNILSSDFLQSSIREVMEKTQSTV